MTLLALAPAAVSPMSGSSRVVETILPALAYNAAFSSTVSLQTLANRTVFLDLEAHRSDGALVPLEGRSGTALRLAPGESGAYKLQLKEDPGDTWIEGSLGASVA